MIEIISGITLLPEAKAILSASPSVNYFQDEKLDPITIDKMEIAPWGASNNLPQEILDLISVSDVLGANLRFNRDVCYGLGPKLVRVERNDKGKVVDYVEMESGKEYDFFERNDIAMFLLEQLTDMVTFHNAFAEMIPSGSKNEIYSLRSKEAAFSRWAVMDKNGQINTHYYSAKWHDSPGKGDITASRVIDEFNAMADVTAKVALNKKRMIYPVYMPSPSRPYYSRPEWHSLFESGWYDHSVAIPALKKAIMKNNLGVKFIIYISDEYFQDIFQKEGIDMHDRKAVKERVDKEKAAFNEFLSGADNASKAIMAIKKFVPSGSGAIENKWIEIEPIKNDLTGGEYIPDLETVTSIMCYATGVHPSLIGAVPGKSSGSMSGTDKRELYLMKQALMKPLVDRVLRPLKLIKMFNKWDADVSIIVPEYIFTTLDKAKSGKEESTTKQI